MSRSQYQYFPQVLPAWFLAGALTLLGTIMHRESLDLTHSLGTPYAPLLNLHYGIALPATIKTLCAAKIIQCLLLWGMLRNFKRMDKAVAGFVAALFLSLHPFFAINSGRLAMVTAIFALFWWMHERAPWLPLPHWILPALVSLGGAIFFSPWFILLFSLFPMLSGSTSQLPTSLRRSGEVGLAALIGILLFLFFLPAFESRRLALLTGDGPYWLNNILRFAAVLEASHSWGAALITVFGLGFGAILAPEVALGLLVTGVIVAGVAYADLVAIMVVWLIVCVLAGRIMEDIHRREILWLSNGVMTILIAALFWMTPGEEVYELLKPTTIYTAERMKRQCGEQVEAQGFPSETLVQVEAALSDSDGCWVAFGNYHRPLPGRYLATLHFCYSGKPGTFVDVAQDHGKRVLRRRSLPTNTAFDRECSALSSFSFVYDTFQHPGSLIEHRVFFSGSGSLWLSHIDVEGLP